LNTIETNRLKKNKKSNALGHLKGDEKPLTFFNHRFNGY